MVDPGQGYPKKNRNLPRVEATLHISHHGRDWWRSVTWKSGKEKPPRLGHAIRRDVLREYLGSLDYFTPIYSVSQWTLR